MFFTVLKNLRLVDFSDIILYNGDRYQNFIKVYIPIYRINCKANRRKCIVLNR